MIHPHTYLTQNRGGRGFVEMRSAGISTHASAINESHSENIKVPPELPSHGMPNSTAGFDIRVSRHASSTIRYRKRPPVESAIGNRGHHGEGQFGLWAGSRGHIGRRQLGLDQMEILSQVLSGQRQRPRYPGFR